MPSIIIHLAIGQEYIKKNKVKNKQEFLKGSIAPDFKEDLKTKNQEKQESHFTSLINGKQVIEIEKLKNSLKIDINSDFGKGYFLHILTDYYFYQKYFKNENEKAIKEKGSLYEDYNRLNKRLIDYYKIKEIGNFTENTNSSNANPEYLHFDKIKDFIEDMSNLDIDDILENKNY